jgi:TetR/AcrR family transcriptional regulator, transcriptional repressor for nem operon
MIIISRSMSVRYGREHKSESRSRIVESAAREFRIKGPDKVGVADVMSGAGLTHGAFYAHFASKDALVAEAIDAMFSETRRLTQALDVALAGGEAEIRTAFRAFVGSYLSAQHRDAPECGCPLPALAADMARTDSAAKARFAAGVERLSGRIAAVLERLGFAESVAEANVMLAQLAGAIGLARAVGDSARSDAILRDTFKAIATRFDL